MPERQDHQRDPGKPHEQPGELLEVGDAGAPARRAGIVQAGGAVVAALLDRGRLAAAELQVGAAHRKCSHMWMPVTTPAGTMSSRKTMPTIQNISRW